MVQAKEKRSVSKEETTKRDRYMQRGTALKDARSEWLSNWRDIADYMAPNRFREFTSDGNRGQRRGQRIINFTPMEAARTLASGMASGISSPSRPWFRLLLSAVEPADVERVEAANDTADAKQWLAQVEDAIRETCARSNIYSGLANVYADVGPFGIGCIMLEEDAEDGARAYHFAVGTYCLGAGPRGDVDTLYREVSLTVSQVVDDFGIENCTKSTREMYMQNQLDARITVGHMVTPNREYREGYVGPAGKRWASCWWELQSSSADGFLREAGYDEKPFMAPRWAVTGTSEDVYGRGPGWDALGDARALQVLERRVAQAAEKMVNPPMSAPTSAQSQSISLLPGGVSYVDSLGAGQVLRPAQVIDPNAITVGEMKIRQHEDRVRRAFYAHLWLMLATQDTPQMTAREVDERREEKLQQLGVVLEQLQDELLDPLIDRLFAILVRQGRIPPPPDSIQGLNFKPEYISIMAQAQKALQTTGLSRVANFVAAMQPVMPDVMDKVNFDKVTDELAEAVGVPPNIIRSDDEVAAIRERRAAAQQAQQQAMMAQEAASTAKTLGDTPTEGPNALSELLRGMGAR